MNLTIDNTPLLWPAALSTGLMLFLTVYSWRRRSVPAALPFAVACAFSALWGFGAILELTAASVAAKYTWFKFQLVWILPAFSAIVCFVLEYANPGRWLNRRTLILLSIIPVLALMVIVANDPYHLLWLSPTHQDVHPLHQGSLYRFLILYILLLGMLNLGIFIWLFIRSPQHRLPVVFMVAGQLAARTLFLLGTGSSLLFDPTRVFSIFAAIPFTMYAIALFRFRIFDPVPFARQAALEQMSEGMLVIDPRRRVASLNKAAEKSLGASGKRLRGSPVAELVPDFDQLEAQLASKEAARPRNHAA